MIKAVVALCVVAGAVIAAQPAAPTLPKELRRVLDRELLDVVSALDGVVGYAALDLTSNEEIGRLEREEFPTASTIKLAVLYELFRQSEEGKLRLEASAPLDRTAVVGGTGILHALGTPTLSLRDHAVLMMALSDNTATNVVIDRVTIPAVAARMKSIGLAGIRLRRKMMDGAAAARGDENVATPRDIVHLLRAMKPAELEVLAVGSSGYLRRGIPSGVQVLSKSGELEGVRVDAALVRAQHRPYAVAVMTTFLKDEEEGERAIASLSRAFYGYFSRLGFGSEFGRQLKRP
jgi:beta-lactamase class A